MPGRDTVAVERLWRGGSRLPWPRRYRHLDWSCPASGFGRSGCRFGTVDCRGADQHRMGSAGRGSRQRIAECQLDVALQKRGRGCPPLPCRRGLQRLCLLAGYQYPHGQGQPLDDSEIWTRQSIFAGYGHHLGRSRSIGYPQGSFARAAYGDRQHRLLHRLLVRPAETGRLGICPIAQQDR